MSKKLETWCPEHGPFVVTDDDGCCVLCGATAIGDSVTEMMETYRSIKPMMLAIHDREKAAVIAALEKAAKMGLLTQESYMTQLYAKCGVNEYTDEDRARQAGKAMGAAYLKDLIISLIARIREAKDWKEVIEGASTRNTGTGCRRLARKCVAK